jgi:hypothetical protein
MQIITNYVLKDEPCHGMVEGPYAMPNPNGKGTRRRWVQRVFVIRDDAIAKYLWDIGPVQDYEDRVMPILMPSFGENTVAELQAHAEKNRHETKYMDRRREMMAESTLVRDAIDQVELRYLAKSNRTVVGPHHRVERNAWPEQTAVRVLRDRVKERKNGRR